MFNTAPRSEPERTERENNWYSVTGRAGVVKVEAHRDLHTLRLQMRLATNRDSLSAKYRQSRSDAKFEPFT